MTLHDIYTGTRPPRANPCDTCKNKDDCDSICIQRGRWWDAQMEKLRKELGL